MDDRSDSSVVSQQHRRSNRGISTKTAQGMVKTLFWLWVDVAGHPCAASPVFLPVHSVWPILAICGAFRGFNEALDTCGAVRPLGGELERFGLFRLDNFVWYPPNMSHQIENIADGFDASVNAVGLDASGIEAVWVVLGRRLSRLADDAWAMGDYQEFLSAVTRLTPVLRNLRLEPVPEPEADIFDGLLTGPA